MFAGLIQILFCFIYSYIVVRIENRRLTFQPKVYLKLNYKYICQLHTDIENRRLTLQSKVYLKLNYKYICQLHSDIENVQALTRNLYNIQLNNMEEWSIEVYRIYKLQEVSTHFGMHRLT